MSVARGSQNGGHYYSNIVMPQEVLVSFTVTPTNSLGVTSVKSNGWVRNVFMQTSTTPGSNNGATNPDPENGYAVIQLNQSFNVFLGLGWSFNPPTTGGTVTSTTSNNVYVINTLGTTTAAQWLAAGLPAGLTAAVGQAFAAIATGAIGGTGTVKVSGTSGIMSCEVVGDPATEISNSDIAVSGGAYVIVRFLNTSGTATAPTTATVVQLRLLFDRSSVTVDGL